MSAAASAASAAKETVQQAASSLNTALAAFGSGPLAEELKKEVSALSTEDQSKAAGMMKVAEKENEQKGAFGAMINYLKTISNSEQLKSLCMAAECVADPDVESCSPVEPVKSLVEWIDGQATWGKTAKKIFKKVTVYPLVAMFATAKEAGVAFLGPPGKMMDEGIKKFEVACEIHDAATAAQSCVVEKIMKLSLFVQGALDHLGKAEFLKTLNLYDDLNVGTTLSTKSLLKCISKEVGEPVTVKKLTQLYNELKD